MGVVMAFPVRASPTTFPSGHAMHVGAVAPPFPGPIGSRRRSPGVLAASLQQPGSYLLAHWTTDVLAGLAMGALVDGVCGRYPDGRVSRSASKPDASGWGQLASVSRRPTPEME